MAILSVAVFVAVMILIISEKVHRAAAALGGAVILLITGVLSGESAIHHIDFNTMGVLLGMMIFVGVAKQSGLFEFIAIKAAKIAKGDPWKIMVYFVIITAVLSAFLDNVTTVLLIAPMTLTITRMIKVEPMPFLMMQVMASNIGGTGTLIGDPPNIMIGSAANLSFMDFLVNDGVPVVFILAAQVLVMKIFYKKNLYTEELDTRKILSMDEYASIADKALLWKSVITLILVVAAFMLHDTLGLHSSYIALGAGALMLIFGKRPIDETMETVEWKTLLFFMSLFMVVGGMVDAGVIDKLATLILDVTHGKPVMTMIIILWASAIFSSFLDNIPFVATMIPLIMAMETQGVAVEPLWWALSLGACLGGNGTLIGASANIIVADISTRNGHPITFNSFLKTGFPMMIMTVFIAMGYLLIRYYLHWA